PGVQVFADFADVFAVGIEFQHLRRGGAIGRTGAVAAVEYEYVLLRVDRDARRLAQVQVRRQLQKVDRGIEGDLGDLRAVLGKCHCAEACDCEKRVEFHGTSLGLLTAPRELYQIRTESGECPYT